MLRTIFSNPICLVVGKPRAAGRVRQALILAFKRPSPQASNLLPEKRKLAAY